MYQKNILKHKSSGVFLRLVKKQKSNVNTFLLVDRNNNPIIEKRSWSTRPDEQLILIKGFDNLVLVGG